MHAALRSSASPARLGAEAGGSRCKFLLCSDQLCDPGQFPLWDLLLVCTERSKPFRLRMQVHCRRWSLAQLLTESGTQQLPGDCWLLLLSHVIGWATKKQPEDVQGHRACGFKGRPMCVSCWRKSSPGVASSWQLLHSSTLPGCPLPHPRPLCPVPPPSHPLTPLHCPTTTHPPTP